MPSLNALDLYVIAQELDDLLQGRKVRETRVERWEVIFRLDRPPHLRIVLHPSHLGIALGEEVGGESLPALTTLLRRRSIRGIRARAGDRVLMIHLGYRGVVVELTGRHRNVLVLDGDTRVLWSRFASRIAPGSPYTFPPHSRSFLEALQDPSHRERVIPYASRIPDLPAYLCQAQRHSRPVVVFQEGIPRFVAPLPVPLQPGEEALPVALLVEGFTLMWEFHREEAERPSRTSPSRTDRVRRRLEEELKRLSAYEAYRNLAEQLLQVGHPQHEDRVFREGNIEVVLRAGEDPVAMAQELFARYRKARRGFEAVKARLEALEQGGSPLPTGEKRRSSPGVSGMRRRPYRVFLGPAGSRILVGKSAQDNHRLTFHWSTPRAWWFHARDVPGAHVVLPDPEAPASDREEAARLALFFSGARKSGRGAVWMTRRRFVRSIPGAPGKVRVLRGEVIQVTLPEGWQPTPAEG